MVVTTEVTLKLAEVSASPNGISLVTASHSAMDRQTSTRNTRKARTCRSRNSSIGRPMIAPIYSAKGSAPAIMNRIPTQWIAGLSK